MSLIRLPLSPAMTMARPIRMAKTMICRMLPSAIAATGLVGIRLTTTSISDGAALTSTALAASRPIPTPGCMIVPKTSPMVMATAVVAR